MKLVATVKLQKAKGRAENSKAYFQYMYKTVTSMLAKAGNIDHPYLKGQSSEKVGIVVITSDRGLAGGYNSNVAKLVLSSGFEKENVRLYTVGKKGADILSRKGYQIAENYSDVIEEPTFEDAKRVGNRLLQDYMNGEIGEIYVAYTEFKNTVVHIPKLVKLLPVDTAEMEEETTESDAEKLTLMNFEPSEEEAISLLVPKYVTSILYGAFVEAVASENGARMQAMDSATNNAEEIISDLELKYNRARQGAITQELTEIIAGADAIG
jgi:F-type H+-transporting ATPase subunit gamma